VTETETELSQERREIIRDLEVPEHFDAAAEIERRVAFLAERLTTTGARALVLGISGGVDSLTAGRLCRLAVDRAREAGHDAEYVAMRLPYGVQKDEKDAARAVEFGAPDRCLTVDVRPATDAMAAYSRAAELAPDDVRVAPEPTPPESVSEHDDRRTAGSALYVREYAAQDGADAEHSKQFRRRQQQADLLRAVAPDDIQRKRYREPLSNGDHSF
jgi:NH3-dependent NAD+ synthetase